MDAAWGEADDPVPRLYAGAVDVFLLLHCTGGEPGNVRFAASVHLTRLCSLPADQCTAGLHAAFRHTVHDVSNHFRDHFIDSDIIEEIERLGTGCQNIVHTHRHRIDADRSMTPVIDREFEFRTDTIRARYEYRRFHIKFGQVECRTKAAQAADDFAAHRAPDMSVHSFDRFIAGFDIDAGLLVLFCHVRLLSSPDLFPE